MHGFKLCIKFLILSNKVNFVKLFLFETFYFFYFVILGRNRIEKSGKLFIL